MNAVIKSEASEIPALLLALAQACMEVDPLTAGKFTPATDDLLEATAVLSAWLPSFDIVLREARHQ